MSTSTSLNEQISDYVRSRALTREGGVLERLRTRTSELEYARMQISVEQGRFMDVLVRSIGAKRAVEVGTFTGYSALCVAAALPADGKLVACDISEEWTSIGKPFWKEAGVADRIDLRIGPASATLQAMLDAGEAGQYDFSFIDADKTGYDDYYEKCLALSRPGGVITVDNIFFGGSAIDPPEGHADGAAIKALTAKIFADERVDASLIPIGDGLVVARKR